jgi:hypothetical protein
MTYANVKTLTSQFFFSANAACILDVVMFQSVPPLSKTGQFLFWPQNYLPFLHLHSGGPMGARVTFLLVAAVLTVCILLTLRLLAREFWNEAFLGTAQGLLSVLAPTIGWLALAPFDRTATILIAIETICLIFSIWYRRRTRTRPKSWEVILIVFVFLWWMYLYWSHVDPAMFTVPLFGCCSYLAWAFWATVSRPGQQQMMPAGEPS